MTKRIPGKLPSLITKRSVVIRGHKTSVSLEKVFWDRLCQLARERGQKLTTLVMDIEEGAKTGNLSSAIRLYLFDQALKR